MTTTYEFVVETLENDGADPDIIDTCGFESMAEAEHYAWACVEPWRIALRRDTGNDMVGLTDRFYAYPDADGKLPEFMETATDLADGPPIPKKYRALRIPIDPRN